MKNIQEFQDHVISEYPREAVGLVIEDTFIPLPNISSNPFDSFLVEKGTYLTYEGTIEAVIHSHTCVGTVHEDPRTPSKADMMLAQGTGVPQGIAHCEGRNVSDILYFNTKAPAELLGRYYISGVYDCHTIVRDYFIIEHNFSMNLMPRGSDWVEADPLFLVNNLESQGFERVIKGQEQVGDVLVFAYGTRYYSHLGIYLGNDTFIHHLQKRPSCEDRLSAYSRQHGATYRRKPNG